MTKTGSSIIAVVAAAALGAEASAQPEAFRTGPVISEFGPAADIEGGSPIPSDATFRVSFDVAEAAKPGDLNRSLVSGARFLNMHARAGVSADAVDLAFIVHGESVHDVTEDGHYEGKYSVKNANAALISELLSHGVRIEVCGQSAAARGVDAKDLLPGVTMSLSAMTSHALLQQQGYTLNPF